MKLHFWERIEHRFRHPSPAAPASDEASRATSLHGRDRFRAWLSELGHDLINLDRANIDRSDKDKDEPPRPH